VTAHREAILAALRRHPVIVVSGDTGSGKTTQLPKMALALGRGAQGRRIAVTQPRRLATVTMAERVADELHTPLGALVGYQHRFARRLSRETRITFMTDGVLLAETRGDPLLTAYDTIIVDEAHERTLNIDFLLGILRRILRRRRDLKVIVSSATLDTASFARFFDDAPVITVPGRLYPVDIRYRPPADGEETELSREVAAAVRELPRDGDILVFLPGERDIRETADRLKGLTGGADEIIPLLASLPAGEQARAFRLSARRRIILATNVAETSVTIPGIRAVIDSGLARLSRYIHRTQVQRLQIERVSQASARQRAGRCGRLGPGTCLRLYSEEDFDSRDAFTPPEVLRSSLAGVILTMLDLRLGDIADFPFLDPPRPAMIREGLAELLELGAVRLDATGAPQLTRIGRALAAMPVEPRFGRILLAASELAVLPSVLPVVAALACDDPRRRPVDEREKAQAAHAQWRVPGSDFLGTRALWNWWERETHALSNARLRRLSAENWLSYPKMREWRDLTLQLEQLARRLKLDLSNDTGGDDAFHRALMTGLLGRLGRYDEEAREYRGAHGVRFAVHPSSVLARKQPPWIVAGELVDTTRLFARQVAAIDERWIERAAGDLCRRHVHSPVWDAERGFVRATEQVTLYGLVIVAARRCDYSRFNQPAARELFIRFGLVDGAFPRPPPEVRANAAVIAELKSRAEKRRRPDLFDAAGLEAFFARAVPPDVASADALRRWLRRATEAERAAFRLDRRDWRQTPADENDFPARMTIGGVTMTLGYRHAPDDPDVDGITCTVRKSGAAALRLWRADWLVPGALAGKLTWMLSSLPSALRRVLAPIDERVSVLLTLLRPGDEPLEDAVRRAVYSQWGFRLPADAWRTLVPPPHLRVRYRVCDDETGRPIAVSRDLDAVLRAAGVSATSAAAVAGPAAGVKHVTWDFPPLDSLGGDGRAGWTVSSYPALHDEGDGVTLRLYPDRATAEAEQAAGTVRLAVLALKGKVRPALRTAALPLASALFLKDLDYSDARVTADLLEGAVREALVRGRPPVSDAAAFARRLDEGLSDVIRLQAELAGILRDTLAAAAELSGRLESDRLPPSTVESVGTQLAWLVYPGFLRLVPVAHLRQYKRYLRGAALRLDRARLSPAGDASKEARFAPYWARVENARRPGSRINAAALAAYRWLTEEYRISLFAQELRTSVPVSPKRLDTLWRDVEIE
jgi:ATP-dependent helicase HrpA